MSARLQQCSVERLPITEQQCWRHEYSFSCALRVGFMFAVLNYHVAINLRRALEESLCQSTGHHRYCVISTKSSTSRKRQEKWTFTLRLSKESARSFLTALTPQIPIPLECRLPLETPESLSSVTFTRSSETIRHSRSFPFAEVIFCPSS